MHHAFAERVKEIIERDSSIIGLAAGGSYINNELDEFSDLDLIIVTREELGGNKDLMVRYARSFGEFVSGFTGEHVGEPRVLICLYDNPLLHVDIKFVTLADFHTRVEDPIILFERENLLSIAISTSKANWPETDFQWIEDRFWIWIHYAALKIGRGELLEALDMLAYLRSTVLAPLALIANDRQARGVRRVEQNLPDTTMKRLVATIATYDKNDILRAYNQAIVNYRELKERLFQGTVTDQSRTEELATAYLNEIASPQS